MLAGLGLGAGVAVGSVGAAIGLASARQEVKWQYDCWIVKYFLLSVDRGEGVILLISLFFYREYKI